MTTRSYVIIIGAMKSGTTTLFDMLARHPKLAPSNPKEPGFFAFEENWQKGFDWFDTLFEFDPDRHLYRLEASTDYTKAPFLPGIWERMRANPDVQVKLLYIMRHPFRRIESHARHVQGAKMELGLWKSPKTDHALDQGISSVNLAVSQYAMQLDQYAEAWKAGSLHCLTLEGLRADPEGTLAGVFAFLGLDPTEVETELTVSNAADSHIRIHPAWEKMANVKPLIAAGKAVLPKSLRQSIRGRFQQKIEVDGRFALSAEETAWLEVFYRADLQRLKTRYGIDIGAFWGFAP